MNFTHLKTFVTVAERRHFARAASACNLSQPAVSHQIAQLEEEVGARLLNRAARRVSLTVAGEVMLEEARRVLASVDRARERMHQVISGAVGRIRLGASPTPGLYLMPPLLAMYRAAHPTFELQYQIGVADEIAERVIRNDLDMGIVAGRPPTSELRAQKLLPGELIAVAAPDVARRGGRTPALDKVCWILREDKSVTRRLVDAWLTRRGIVPAQTLTFEGPDAVKHAVLAGLGMAIVPKLTVREELKAKKLVEVNVPGTLPALDIFLVDHPQKHHGVACSAMLRLLEQRFLERGSNGGSDGGSSTEVRTEVRTRVR
ncbi:MAG: LysR family transcriptional regulator [Acidobacteria bacterium]|nr:LysR family transcriptional regulator [Acidobacteriota bacterium]